MNEQLKEKFPKWCFDNEQYSTVLTDDLDSLIGCAIEQKINDNRINYFYDFNTIFIADRLNKNKLLGIDLALTKGKCWDNHVTRLKKDNKVNVQSANINAIINVSGDNYYDKYCGSTALVVWSFYDLPLPTTKLGKMLLLCVDSGFLGHYNSRYRKVHNEFLRMLGYDELINLLNETDISEFEQLQKEYKTKNKIKLDENGYLHTYLPLLMLSDALELQLELPKQQFSIQFKYKSHQGHITDDDSGDLRKNVVSFALTGKKFYKYTYKKRENLI